MKYCTLILMTSLPTVWLAVGIGLVVIIAVLLFVCVFKWREVAMLKKEVLELRDTMRMMRYEEANLSRMLHAVEKPCDNVLVPSAEDADVSVPTAEEQVPEEPAAEEPMDEHDVVEEPVVTENVPDEPDEPVVETQSLEEVPVADASEVEEPVVTKPRKQAINERRPAIPNDLFAAWFEENDPIETKESEEDFATRSEKTDENVEVAQEAEVEVSIPETFTAEEHLDVPGEAGDGIGTAGQMEEGALQGNEPIELSKEDERFCRKLERIVSTRMRNPNLNIDVIASQFAIGRTNFYRKVRELMGISPNDYLRKCRMERAAELLLTTEMNITEICTQVGIPDAQYFSRVFKAHFGMPPSAYREQK